MHVLCTGLNHKTAPLEVRERVSFSKEQLQQALPALKADISEGVILSTCNRTEVYTVSETPETSTQAISSFLSRFHSVAPESFTPHTYHYVDLEAVRHLFRVASGLDSLILGESQILGQVRDALTATAATGSPGVPLSRLFHYALRTGRRVRDETDIGTNAFSVSYAGVRLAERVLGDLKSRSVLLVGAGKAGRLAARALRTAGVEGLFISNRTLSRAEELAQELHGQPVPFNQVMDTLKGCDIAISSTDAPEMVLTQAAVADVMDTRDGRPLFIFDLAVPRDIDPQVTGLPGVYLFNMDDLEAIAEENRLERQKSAAAAEVIVEEEVERFTRWWRSLETVPLVKGLLQEAEAIRKMEVEKALRHLPDMTPQQRKAVEQLSRSIVNKLLHKPITALKEPNAASHLQAIKELLQADNSTEADSAAQG